MPRQLYTFTLQICMLLITVIFATSCYASSPIEGVWRNAERDYYLVYTPGRMTAHNSGRGYVPRYLINVVNDTKNPKEIRDFTNSVCGEDAIMDMRGIYRVRGNCLEIRYESNGVAPSFKSSSECTGYTLVTKDVEGFLSQYLEQEHPSKERRHRRFSFFRRRARWCEQNTLPPLPERWAKDRALLYHYPKYAEQVYNEDPIMAGIFLSLRWQITPFPERRAPARHPVRCFGQAAFWCAV